jgi:hypothetical protein
MIDLRGLRTKLEEYQDNEDLTSIHFNGGACWVTGFILDINPDSVEVQIIDQHGQEDGTVVIPLHNISNFSQGTRAIRETANKYRLSFESKKRLIEKAFQ